MFAYNTKLLSMATSLKESEKNGPDQENSRKYLPFGEKIVKIGPVDTEITLLVVKKRKLENPWQSLGYSPLGAVVSPPSENL